MAITALQGLREEERRSWELMCWTKDWDCALSSFEHGRRSPLNCGQYVDTIAISNWGSSSSLSLVWLSFGLCGCCWVKWGDDFKVVVFTWDLCFCLWFNRRVVKDQYGVLTRLSTASNARSSLRCWWKSVLYENSIFLTLIYSLWISLSFPRYHYKCIE